MEVLALLVLVGTYFGYRTYNSAGFVTEELHSKELLEKLELTRDYIDSIKTTLNNQTSITYIKDTVYGFIEDASVELHEPRSKRIAGYSGVRVAKGIFIGGSQARSYQEMRRLDSGKLKLTFNELLFMGDLETRTIELKRIMDIEPYIDGFKLAIKNRQKPIIFTGVQESGSWSMVIYLLRSLSSQHIRKQTLDLDVVNREIDDILSEIDTQIATEKKVFLFRLNKIGFSLLLADIFENPKIQKIEIIQYLMEQVAFHHILHLESFHQKNVFLKRSN